MNKKPIKKQTFTQCKAFRNNRFFDETIIGKTPKELGFGFLTME